jgi:hypothetical protein
MVLRVVTPIGETKTRKKAQALSGTGHETEDPSEKGVSDGHGTYITHCRYKQGIRD